MRLGRGGCRSKGVRAGRVCADSRCPCLRRRTAGRSTASPAGLGRKRGPCGGDLQYAEAILEQWGEKLYKAQQRYIARGMRRHRRFSN